MTRKLILAQEPGGSDAVRDIPTQKLTLNIEEACKYVGVCRKSLNQLLDDKTIPYILVGKRRRIPVHALVKTLANIQAKGKVSD